MAIGIFFQLKGMTAQNYAETLKQLEAAGAGAPKGRTYHSAFGPAESLMVFDVWNSQEEFDAFGQTLMPILSSLGIDPGEPDVMPIHNTILG